MKQQNIAITGATGFIGSHLCHFFQNQGYNVYKISRETLYDRELLRKTLQAINPVYILHLAAYGNHSSQIYIDDTIRANILATYYLLEASTDIPYQAFINFGSSSEYGKKQRIMKETDLPEGDSFYAATKIATTYLSTAFAKKFDKNIVTVRPFSVYGEGEADHRFIPSAIYALLNDNDYSLFATPEHDWIYVKDFVSGVLAVLENSEQLKGQVINIGTGNSWKNSTVISLLESIAKKKMKLKEVARDDNYSPVWQADNQLLQSLGWQPEYSFMEGLKRTYQFYINKYEKNN